MKTIQFVVKNSPTFQAITTGDGGVLCSVEVEPIDTQYITETMYHALTEQGVDESTAGNITRDIQQVIDRHLLFEMLREHISTVKR